MGKRKSSSKPMGPKKGGSGAFALTLIQKDPLPTTFACLFCNHENSVSVKLDKKAGVGQLDCRVCGQKFQCAVNYLSAAVDVYGEWVDAADAVAKEDNAEPGYTGTSQAGAGRGNRTAVDEDDDEHYGEDDY
ncbi:ELF1 [Fusarium tjaetaba]|uniref:Transcription elongation factor 1 homolog n=1 Tax=Fusarium tjaetaba TaxID=1567544 RepID=A0A8H5QQ32_9HYPO|nr:ELF1 [Fusarium tjaetaba]KAF5617766.1 ELF1 [Fusarium tjaetaba]